MDFSEIHLLSRYAKEYGHVAIREAGITETEHRICTFIHFHSNVYQDLVANALMLDKTTVAKALVSLEERGLIERFRNPENRRKNILTITELGKEAIGDVIGIYDEWLEKVESCLSDQEREQFHSYCRRLLDKAKEINEQGS